MRVFIDVLVGMLLPVWAALCVVIPSQRSVWRERWLGGVARCEPGVVWVHAASVGECRGAQHLIQHLPRPVLLTVDTVAARDVARQALQRETQVVVRMRPVDHPWIFRPLWADLRPRALLFVEGTLWPSLAGFARSQGVPVARVSAKLGARTRAFGGLGARGWWAGGVELVCARDEEQAAFFRAHQAAEVVVCGDLKEGAASDPSPLTWTRPLVVAGCTHAEDERALLETLADRMGGIQLAIAPRRVDRAGDVCGRWSRQGYRAVLRTSLTSTRVPADVDVVVIDTMGELASVYQGARVAVIGGGLSSPGKSHAPWEALNQGIDVIMGPGARQQGYASLPGVACAEESQWGRLVGRSLGTPPRKAQRGPPPAITTARRVLGILGVPAPEVSPRPWAWPLSLAWRVGARIRAAVPRAEAEGTPWVLCVGSENARGPGRTTLCRALARALRAKGHRVGLSFRGYRRPRRGTGVRCSWETASFTLLGDEAALLAGDGFDVVSGPDRRNAVRLLGARDCTVVLLDDASQRPRLPVHGEIEVVDARFPNGRGWIPMGERRDDALSRRRGVLRIVQHAEGRCLAAGWRVSRRFCGLQDDGGPIAFRGGPFAVAAGIARPADVLAALPFDVERFRPLRDHARLDARTITALKRWAGHARLILTEKDMVRIEGEARQGVGWMVLETRLPKGFVAEALALCDENGT